MNIIASIFVAALCINAALSSPISLKEDTDETRTIYTSGGGLYLGFNSTILYLAIFGLGALALILYIGASTGLLDERSSANQQRYDQYEPYQEQVYREKRSFDESKSINVMYNLSTNM